MKVQHINTILASVFLLSIFINNVSAESIEENLKIIQKRPQLSHRAVAQLVGMGEKAVPPLIDLYKKKRNPNLRRTILICFRDMGPKAKEAIPLLMDALEKWNSDYVGFAIKALQKIGKPAVNDLTLALDSSNSNLKRGAIISIVSIPPVSKSTEAKIIKMAADKKEEYEVRYSAIWSLKKLEFQPEYFPIFDELINSEKGKISEVASSVLLQWVKTPEDRSKAAEIYSRKNPIHPIFSSMKPISSETSSNADKESYSLGFNDNKFFPLGFTQNGYFVYFLGSINGGCGYCPRITLYNLVKDKIIESKRFDGFGPIQMAKATEKIKEWKLKPNNELPLEKFPANINSDTYDAFIKNGKLWVESKKRGKKKVSSSKSHLAMFMEDDELPILIEGFFKDHDNNRVAIILSGLSRGFEGETSIRYFVVGSHLKVGFK